MIGQSTSVETRLDQLERQLERARNQHYALRTLVIVVTVVLVAVLFAVALTVGSH